MVFHLVRKCLGKLVFLSMELLMDYWSVCSSALLKDALMV
jgi:hypothetical protein